MHIFKGSLCLCCEEQRTNMDAKSQLKKFQRRESHLKKNRDQRGISSQILCILGTNVVLA
jgi:hypothetical protein